MKENPMTTQKVPLIDKNAVSAGFDRVAKHYEQNTFFEQQLCDDLASRLTLLSLAPHAVLDLGTSTGRTAAMLHRLFPQAKVTGVDFSPRMIEEAQKNYPQLHFSWSDASALPFQNQSFDLIVSNLLFPLIDDLEPVLTEAYRVLRPEGCLLFTTVGPDSFHELREAWLQVDQNAHIIPFLDMHDVGDALIHSQFVEPVMDRDILTITYAELKTLFNELKLTGNRNFLLARSKSCLGKNHFRKMQEAYSMNTATSRYEVTVEVIYGLAWKGHPQFSQTIHDNAVHIPIEILKRS